MQLASGKDRMTMGKTKQREQYDSKIVYIQTTTYLRKGGFKWENFIVPLADVNS